MYSFLVKINNDYINTYNGYKADILDFFNEDEISNGRLFSYKVKFKHKYNVDICPYIVEKDCLYSFSVKLVEDTAILEVFNGIFENNKINWTSVYSASVKKNVKGVIETGDGDIDFWHDFFATEMLNLPSHSEFCVNFYDLNNNSMEMIRKIFPMHLQENVFLFLKNYAKLKNVTQKEYDLNLFNIPAVKIDKNVGKRFNNKRINYACQREIIINNEPFFDITVITGMVNEGIMDIEKKNRFFLNRDFAYSPDGGDLAILIAPDTFGIVYDDKMAKKHPDIKNYKGTFYYQYFLSKYYIPCFEILAKAGYWGIADKFLDEYQDSIIEYHNFDKRYYDFKKTDKWSPSINVYGRNANEIFGFNLNKFNKFIFDDNGFLENESFIPFITNIRNIIEFAPFALNDEKLDYELYKYITKRLRWNLPIESREISYLRKIGTSNSDLYHDYLNLCNLSKFFSDGKYPNNLKYEHDVMTAYYNQVQEAIKDTYFVNAVETEIYKKNIYDVEGEEYCILSPRKPDDLVKESGSLHHCVKSYISNVSKGRTRIYFLRRRTSKSNSLVTLEVDYNNVVCQARGKYNRSLYPDEINFVEKWAKAKNLVTNYRF